MRANGRGRRRGRNWVSESEEMLRPNLVIQLQKGGRGEEDEMNRNMEHGRGKRCGQDEKRTGPFHICVYIEWDLIMTGRNKKKVARQKENTKGGRKLRGRGRQRGGKKFRPNKRKANHRHLKRRPYRCLFHAFLCE